MHIIKVATGEKKEVVIRKAAPDDFRQLAKKRFSFDWKKYREALHVYKLFIKNEVDILGAMGLEDWPEEKRVEIKLLACSIENKGKEKLYEGIAECLIAFACRMAVAKYGIMACVSLIPKTELIEHYIRKYQMKYAGWQLYLEESALITLLNKHYDE
jgi:hypothetical protein